MLETLAHDIVFIVVGFAMLAGGLWAGLLSIRDFLRADRSNDDAWKQLGFVLLLCFVAILVGASLLVSGVESLLLRVQLWLSELWSTLWKALPT